ncbi:LuxR family transcriptional regulator [Actinomadura sp. DC4]|uniref:ATP-binding protein n=1 Tax=Actinomadura sp. DC4 TaxID=3055069 RepID=UPI0025AFB73D|nr:LuxR family transcriptional regulator [Actinomadura sp. DC4]MDN3354930.1 AAA family ATPase [Actinomadura sp. DC4]
MADSPSPVRREHLLRTADLATVEHLLRATLTGQGGTIVVRGEAGIGKTHLLEHALDRVPDLQRRRAIGKEFESRLPFTALHELCEPMLGDLRSLPDPQRAALEVVFAQREGTVPDRFRVGLAVLGLLTRSARQRPVVCVVDDAQWLDDASAQILAFVARRVEGEPVAFLFALREPAEPGLFDGLPAQSLAGLRNEDALALLSSRFRAPLDERIRDQIIAEARGNPLALLELPRRVGPADLAGGFGLPDSPPVPERIEAGYRERLAGLPSQTQRLVLVAAAEPLGEPVLLWRAAERLGIGAEAAAPAEAAGLLDLGVRVRFRHPLVRSAVYQAASREERRAVHRALAEVTDPQVDPDRRAWHRAQSVFVPDEAVAEELERSADRVCARGGMAAAAVFLERATALTPDPARRAARALAAAEFKHRAGAPEAATGLLATARAGPLDARQRALAELVSAQIAARTGAGSAAPSVLLAAAKGLEPHDRPRALTTYLEAFAAAARAGRCGDRGLLAETARTVRAALTVSPVRPVDLLLDALTAQVTDGHTAAVPLIRTAIRAFLDGTDDEYDGQSLWLVSGAATDAWDEDGWLTLAQRHVRCARRSGALDALPSALCYLALARIHTGEFAEAEMLIDDASAILGSPAAWAGTLLAAWRGEPERLSELTAMSTRTARDRDHGRVLSMVDYANAVLHNGTGRYDVALRAARTAYDHDEPGTSSVLSPELVEAAARSGRPELAEPVLEKLIERTEACGTDWALGVQLRSRALLSEGPGTEDLYREAIDRLQRTRAVAQVARAHLIYGEWLRREARRADARTHLRTAHEQLTAIGAEAFAARAARELSACGERARKPASTPLDLLTAQERQIALLVADGATSKEAAAQLFLSPRTVDAHLRNIFQKLGLTSRRQLRDLRPHRPEDFHPATRPD